MRRGDARDRWQLTMIALFAFSVVGVALVSQHRFDMQPCPWCIVQRMVFSAIGVVSLLASMGPLASARRVHFAAAFICGALAVLGAASALWQQMYAAKSSSCHRTVADVIIGLSQLDTVLPDIFQARASCADAAVTVLGVPYGIWSLVAFLLVAIAATKLHLEQRQRLVIADSAFGDQT